MGRLGFTSILEGYYCPPFCYAGYTAWNISFIFISISLFILFLTLLRLACFSKRVLSFLFSHSSLPLPCPILLLVPFATFMIFFFFFFSTYVEFMTIQFDDLEKKIGCRIKLVNHALKTRLLHVCIVGCVHCLWAGFGITSMLIERVGIF